MKGQKARKRIVVNRRACRKAKTHPDMHASMEIFSWKLEWTRYFRQLGKVANIGNSIHLVKNVILLI